MNINVKDGKLKIKICNRNFDKFNVVWSNLNLVVRVIFDIKYVDG